jgi:uncharacterized membrane protein YkoI
MENTSNRFAGKKAVLVVALLAAAALSTTAVLMLQQPASAQDQSSNATSTIPDLNGSVSIQNATNDFIRENIQVSFTDAANTAQSQVDGGTVVGGKLGVIQGYLVYTFNVANYDAGTSRVVIVDAGNGGVLYTSDEMPLRYGGFGGFGCDPMHGGFGHHSWNGMGKGMSSGSSDVETTSA